MFELGAIDDLVLPGPSSTTGRALMSMARRRLFERSKALAASGADASDESIAALRRAFDARLPGNPHAISDAITDPAIGILLRRGLTRGNRLSLERGIGRLLAELGDAVPTGPVRKSLPVRGPITLRTHDPWLAAAADVEPCSVDPGAMVEALGAAIDLVEERASTMRADLDRFAPAILVSGTLPAALPPCSMGVALVPDTHEPRSLAMALVASVVVGKLHALVEDRAHDAALLARLLPVAANVASSRVHGRALPMPADLRASVEEALQSPTTDASDPLAHVVAELRTITASGILLP